MLKQFIILIFIIFFAFLLPVVISLTTELSLGDEVYHYRFAKNFYLLGRRPVVDILYQNSDRPDIIYVHDIFWHFILSKIWKVTGGISFTVAQVYHTSYYILLIFLTYLLGKELYDRKVGLYSALLVATVPMVIAFSILFYTDIPSVVFGVLCILFVVKKKYLWAGVALGLMYLSKRNSLLFIPAIILIIFYDKVSLKAKFRNLLILFAVASVIIFPDLYWREKSFRGMQPCVYTSANHILHAAATPPAATPPEATSPAATPAGDVVSFVNLATKDFPFLKCFHDYLFLSYFGISVFIALLFYFICRKYKKKDIVLWTLILVYIFFYFYFLGLSKEVRYMLPIVPFFAILASRSMAFVQKKFTKVALIFICVLQLFVTVGYVGMKRNIPQTLKEGFTYIRENTPSDADILYPEYIGLEMMNRRIRWTGDGFPNNIFWSSDTTEVLGAINKSSIDYVFIKKSRIYDDSDFRYIGGYPKSFVERLPTFPFVMLVYENNEASVWEVTGNDE